MEMSAFDQIVLLHVILLVPDVIKAAVAVIIEVVVAVIIVHTIPKEAVLAADTIETALGGNPIHMTHHNHNHLDDTTTDHDLTEDVDPTPAARADLDHQEEGTAVIPILQIANVPGVPQSLPGGNNT